MSDRPSDTWISVDVEASGPSPSTGSLLSVGACLVDEPDRAFYAEIVPDPDRPWSVEAEGVHGLSRAHLAEHGLPLRDAMRGLADWVAVAVPEGSKALFVGFNATYDWMWIADSLARAGIDNPFGISGLDLKAFFLGRHWPEVDRWGGTAKHAVRRRYPSGPGIVHSHNALDDAREQADLARSLRGSRRR